MVSYFDIVLGGIGALLLIGAVLGVFFGPSTIIIFATAAMLLTGHAMFMNPPTTPVAIESISSEIE